VVEVTAAVVVVVDVVRSGDDVVEVVLLGLGGALVVVEGMVSIVAWLDVDVGIAPPEHPARSTAVANAVAADERLTSDLYLIVATMEATAEFPQEVVSTPRPQIQADLLRGFPRTRGDPAAVTCTNLQQSDLPGKAFQWNGCTSSSRSF